MLHTVSNKICTPQNKFVTSMADAKPRNSCSSLYIFSLMKYNANNQEQFQGCMCRQQ